jgi:hypothetical protein
VNGTQQPATSVKDSGKDFSLKEGEKISINIPGLAKKVDKPVAPLLGGGGGLKKLAPPPGAKKPSQSGMTSGFSAPQ